MDRDKLHQKLLEVFFVELSEHVVVMNRELLRLEKDPRDFSALAELRRSAHTLKGAAKSVSIEPIQNICHDLEAIFERFSSQSWNGTHACFQLMFEAIDTVQRIGECTKNGEKFSEWNPSGVLSRLRSMAEKTCDGEHTQEPERSIDVASPVKMSEREGSSFGSFSMIRLSTSRVDKMFSQSEELLVSAQGFEAVEGILSSTCSMIEEWDGDPTIRARLVDVRQEVERASVTLRRENWRLSQAIKRLSGELRSVRMIPFSEACLGLERHVRDLCQLAGKRANLELVGGDVELDRAVIERLKDPLLHLVRNAVDHGLETTTERESLAKPVVGGIRIEAKLRGTGVEITFSDDGRGINKKAVREKAEKRGWAIPSDDQETLDLIFQAGFSTSDKVSDVSGRGIGLDIVRSAATSLQGTLDVSSEEGKGTRFTFRVPLTITSPRVLVFKAGGTTFALPCSNIGRLLEASPDKFYEMEGHAFLTVGSSSLPVYSLSEFFGVRQEGVSPPGGLPTLEIITDGEPIAVTIDEWVSEREVHLKTFGARLKKAKHFLGAAVLPDGKIALLLNASELVSGIRGFGAGDKPLRMQPRENPAPRKKRVILAENSLTTRTLEKAILEAAGYEVVAAVDGEEAWKLLQSLGADLVVTDIEMPKMDGFALTQSIRRSPRFTNLPVILVTALSNDEFRQKGVEVGANGYVCKSEFDQQNLIQLIAKLI